MICPNCGATNKDDALFCASCGTKLQDLTIETDDDSLETDEDFGETKDASLESRSVYAEATKVNVGREDRETKKKRETQKPREPKEEQTEKGLFSGPLSRNEWIPIIVAVVAVIVCVIFFNVQYSAGHVAQKYAEAVLGRDWNTVYDNLLHDKKGDFMTKEAFVTAETISTYGEADTSKVNTLSRGTNDSAGRTYYATYSTGDGEEETMTIYLERSGIFWKVKSDEYLSDSYSLSVPSGATVKVDKIEVSGKYKTSSGNNRDEYTISPIYGATHYVELTGAGFEDTAQVITAAPSKVAEVNTVMGEETATEITQQAVDDLTTILEAAARDQKVSTVTAINNMSSDNLDDAVYEYEYVRDDFFGYQNDKNELVSFKLSNMEAYVQKTVDSSGSDFLQVEIKADYQLDYNKSNLLFGSSAQTTNDTCSFDFYYIRNGTSWLLYAIDLNL